MIWKRSRNDGQPPRRSERGRGERVNRRARGPERLEPRRLLAADPIHVGVVYLETDYLESDQDMGSDSRGDRFIVSFKGGAPQTQLRELRISTDKDGDGLSVGDSIFDTAPGKRGKGGTHGFQIVRVQSASGQPISATAEVEDGGQELIIRLTNFHAGDRLEFTIDVDEITRNAIDLAVFNDRLDVITSGQEFQDSLLEASFEAPHYETSHADNIFLNDYGSPAETVGLALPPDEGSDVDSRPNRSAAAIASTNQVPKPVEISGHVWLDNDLDATRRPGEPLLAGVELSLWKQLANGTYADTGHRATTDTGGQYVFPKSLGLMPGRYRVVESQPAGLFSVAAVPGSVAGRPTGFAESHDVLTNIDIPLGDTAAINNDFAESAPAALSGYVYHDTDLDGRRDVGEAGIAGVRVQLVPILTIAPQAVLTVTTAGDGSYAFTGLAPGSYEVIEVDQPAGLDDGLDSAGTVNGLTVGVAENPGDRITQILLAGMQAGIEYNFGEIPFGTLSGFVYLPAPGSDCDGDHAAAGNLPLAGVQVALQDASGATVARTTTLSDGSYRFEGLVAGVYRVLQFTPAGLIDGMSHVGRIGPLRVGTSIDGGLIQGIAMPPAGVGTEYNFCEAAPAAISGYVYHDQSNDGQRDADEAPIAAVRIELVAVDGQLVAATQTDPSGRYQFAGVLPGQYSIVQRQPAGFLDGIDAVGTVDGRLVGRITGPDSLGEITLKQGQRGAEYNFGELLPASLSGQVHADRDGDCEPDPDERLLSGVTIRLLRADGSEVARTETDSLGQYRFENLAPGNYTVVEEQPPGVLDGDAQVGSVGGRVDGSNRILDILLGSGQNGIDYDFCEHEPGEISGLVYNDRDGDCFRDPGEAGIAGVRIELYGPDGSLVASTLTDDAGRYRFTQLAAATYLIREQQPDGWLQGGQKAGSGGGDDSLDDVISRIELPRGAMLVDYEFCELEPARISGSVFVDGNGDRLRNAGDRPIEAVTIELRDSAGRFIVSTTTDSSGRYQFEQLRPGQYQVFEQQPDGFFHGGQLVGSGDGLVLGDDLLGMSLNPGEQLVEYNFYEWEPSSISGVVYLDEDGDCTRDADEPPLAGVEIELRDTSGQLLARSLTDASGRYRFDYLRPGRYQIFERQPEGVFQGGQSVGTGDGEVLGDDLLAANLLAGQQLVDYNFCELPPSWISGRVWQESQPNQRFDPGDRPLSGVQVELLDESGTVLDQARTDAEGIYRFAGLAPGVYAVREVQPGGLFHGGQVVGDAGGAEGGDDLLVGISLLGGTHANDYNFPEVPPATLSGFVFQDGEAIALQQQPDPKDLRRFRDGQLTPDDTRLGGVVLELRNVLGLPFDAQRALPGVYPPGPIRTTTNELGYYEFTGLRPGTYHVYQLQPGDLLDGLDTPGTTGGFAVNPADEPLEEDRIIIQTLALSERTDPRNDAILNISLDGGGHSSHNNFSEIVVVAPQLPPPLLPQPARNERLLGPAPPLLPADPQIRLVVFTPPPSTLPPTLLQDEWAVAWHLSVINGGFPRGTLSRDGVLHAAGSRQADVDWREGDHDRGRWTIARGERSSDTSGERMTLGDENATALAGDFDGDGVDEAVIYVGGQWLVDLNGNGRWDSGDLWIQLGTQLDRPVVGDWDGDGKDDIGIFGRQWQRDPDRIKQDPGLPDPANLRRRMVDAPAAALRSEDRGEDRQRLLRRGSDGSLRADAVDHVFQYGEQVDVPVAGDWNGDGIDQIAVFRGGQWLLDADGDGRWTSADESVNFGRSGDEPIVGDFNGDGIDEIGVVRGDLWIIDSDGDRRITGNDQRIVVPRSSPDSQPVVGDFDGDGRDQPGYYDEAA